METQLRVAGSLLIALAALHAFFPWRFRWKDELAGLSMLNRQMMYVHVAFIGLVLFLMGLLCLSAPGDLIGTPLGRKVALGLAVFWTIRLAIQFFGYSSELWRGKRFETLFHVTFSLLWFYFSGLFIWIALP